MSAVVLEEKLLTAEELAAYLQVSVDHVRRRCRAEENPWPALRFGNALRFGAEEIARIKKMHAAPAPAKKARSRRRSTKGNDVADSLSTLLPA